jgi:fructoselysine-6-P-deglycase FrlB-like protein
MAEEIRYQIDDLPAFSQHLRSLNFHRQPENEGRNYVFTGAGDSFAAAKAAEYLSGFQARALDPYDICLRPSLLKGKHLFVISVSGRTKTNIEAARAVRGIAEKVTAITADDRSLLAQNCDDCIRLGFRRTGELTPGTGSFTATLLACYSKIRALPKITNLERLFDEYIKWSETLELSSDGTTFMVGTGLNYCLAMYGAAKIYEVLGWRSQYQATEQFSHMELFSLSEKDVVLVLPDSTEDNKAVGLENLLRANGWNVARVDSWHDDAISGSIRIAICLQILAWRTALKAGLQECSFKLKGRHLRVSDEMIY